MSTAEVIDAPANQLQIRPFNIQPITYPVIAAQIQKMADEYMALTIAGVEDKQGHDLVRSSRLKVRDLRLNIDKRRKELKAEPDEYVREVDRAARVLTKLLEPIEAHLQKQEDAWTAEKARIKEEAEEKKRLAIRARLQMLADCGLGLNTVNVETMPDAEWQPFIAEKQEEHRQRVEAAKRADEERREREEAEAAERRKAEAEAAERRRIEEEKLAAERAELDRQRKADDERRAAEQAELDRVRKEQAEAQAKIDAEKQRLADEQAERERAAELELAKAQAAEKAKRDAEERQQREAAEAKARADAEAAEKIRIEQLRPDHEKLLSVAAAVSAIKVPAVSPEAADMAAEVVMLLANAAKRIEHAAGLLLKQKGNNVSA